MQADGSTSWIFSHAVLAPTCRRASGVSIPTWISCAYTALPMFGSFDSSPIWIPPVCTARIPGGSFLPALRWCASKNLTTVYRKFWAGAIHLRRALFGSVHKCCPGILFNYTKIKSFLSDPDKTAFSLPTNWGDFYKTDNADGKRFIKCLHFKRDKIAFSLPTKWGDFYKTGNADWRRFIKCLHFKRDKIAFSLPSKWEKKFSWELSSVFRLLCNSGIMRDFSKGGRGCKKIFESKWEKRRGFAAVYLWRG